MALTALPQELIDRVLLLLARNDLLRLRAASSQWLLLCSEPRVIGQLQNCHDVEIIESRTEFEEWRWNVKYIAMSTQGVLAYGRILGAACRKIRLDVHHVGTAVAFASFARTAVKLTLRCDAAVGSILQVCRCLPLLREFQLLGVHAIDSCMSWAAPALSEACPQLEDIYWMFSARPTDDNAWARHFPKLKSLVMPVCEALPRCLRKTDVDSALDVLRSCPLVEHLEFLYGGLDKDASQALMRETAGRITSLALDGTSIDDASFLSLICGCPKLQTLSLCEMVPGISGELTSATVGVALKSCKCLTELDLQEAYLLDEALIVSLPELRSLQKLKLIGCDALSEDVLELIGTCHASASLSLVELDLSHSFQWDIDVDFSYLSVVFELLVACPKLLLFTWNGSIGDSETADEDDAWERAWQEAYKMFGDFMQAREGRFEGCLE